MLIRTTSQSVDRVRLPNAPPKFYSLIAQLVEQSTVNAWVTRSSRVRGAKSNSRCIMIKINAITEKYATLPYMSHGQALYMRDIIQKNKFKNLCELGHFHGKSSIYLGAILEEQGFGKLTTFDQTWSERLVPRIYDLIDEFSLKEYVTPVISAEGYIWELTKLIESNAQKFDFCYIDGAHSLQDTALAFVLTDILLDKGGIIIFDDLNWTLGAYIATLSDDVANRLRFKNITPIQKNTAQVKMVCDLIIPHYNYTLLEIINNNWAIYQKK